jgi:hypothetical protein
VEIEDGDWLVSSDVTDYSDNWHIEPHSHNKHELIYAIQGVMVVNAALNQWTVRPAVASGCPVAKSAPFVVSVR